MLIKFQILSISKSLPPDTGHISSLDSEKEFLLFIRENPHFFVWPTAGLLVRHTMNTVALEK